MLVGCCSKGIDLAPQHGNNIACVVFFVDMMACVVSLLATNQNIIGKVLLLLMVFIAFHFHMLYTVLYNSENKLKWAEYSVSATLGSLAVLSKGNWEAGNGTVVVGIVALGACTQICGFIIEHIVRKEKAKEIRFFAFVIGCSLFGAELYLSIGNGAGFHGANAAVTSTYLTLYACFPIICLQYQRSNDKCSKPCDMDYIYHFASMLSKTGLVITFLLMEVLPDMRLLAISVPYVILSVVALLAMLLKYSQDLDKDKLCSDASQYGI